MQSWTNDLKKSQYVDNNTRMKESVKSVTLRLLPLALSQSGYLHNNSNSSDTSIYSLDTAHR
jgi:hypothetical protein